MKKFRNILFLLLLIFQQSFGQIDSLRVTTVVPGASYIINGVATGVGIVAEEITPLELRIIDTNDNLSILYKFTDLSKITIDGVTPVNIQDAVRLINTSFSPASAVLTNEDYTLKVSKGQIAGTSVQDKFGENPDVDTGVQEDIWEFGGEYIYDADDTAPIQYLSSSDILDTEPIKITGLDINGDEVSQTLILTGQTIVNLTTPLWRVYRLENEGVNDLLGLVYCHTDPTPVLGVPSAISVRAVINNGNNQSLMALYTIPKGFVGYLYRGELGGSRSVAAGEIQVAYYSRRLGKVFKIKKRLNLSNAGSSIYQDIRSFPDIIPSFTDIKLTVESVSSNNTGVFGTFDILLVDETQFPLSYLQAIGQPGY